MPHMFQSSRLNCAEWSNIEQLSERGKDYKFVLAFLKSLLVGYEIDGIFIGDWKKQLGNSLVGGQEIQSAVDIDVFDIGFEGGSLA
jgi:hypothetical protein